MERRRARRIKLQLVGLSLAVGLLVPYAVKASQTSLMTDAYWRYQGQVIADFIAQTGQLPTVEFPNHSKALGWVNSFTDDFAGPLFVTVVGYFTGLETTTVHNAPIFGIVLVLSTAGVAAALSRRLAVFPIAVAMGVGYKFLMMHTTFAAHRGGAAWAILFAILLYLLVLRRSTGRWKEVGLLVLAVTFPLTVHTLPIAIIPLLVTLLVVGYVASARFISGRECLGIIGAVVVYNTLLSNYLLVVLSKFLHQITHVLVPGLQDFADGLVGTGPSGTEHASNGTTETPNQVSNGTTKSTNQPSNRTSTTTDSASLDRYRQSRFLGGNRLFSGATVLSGLLSVSLTGCAALVRTNRLRLERSARSLDRFDVLLLAVAVQGIADLTVIPFFAPSGGISPILLGLLFTPVFGSVVLAETLGYVTCRNGVPSAAVVSVLLLIVIGVPFGVTVAKPMTPGVQMQSTSAMDEAQLEWADDRLAGQRFTSDFNTVSMYYALGGDGKTHLPDFTGEGYTSDSETRRIVDLYYRNPASSGDSADAYVVADHMKTHGMHHIGSLFTDPNPDLDDQLARDAEWGKVYTTGDGETFVETSGS